MYERREDRINGLAKINNAKNYLEIGVSKGVTFKEVEITNKVAVDPCFRFDTSDDQSNCKYFEVTSDEYFSKICAKENTNFDLIYLDGLHTFEQTFRDFCASLQYSNENTIWLIDDTHPVSMYSADPDMNRAQKLSDIAGYQIKSWMGDVFKVVFAIHDFFPQFSYRTFSGHGQTVFWLETRTEFKPRWNCLEDISRLGFDDFLENRAELLMLSDGASIINTVRESYLQNSSEVQKESMLEAC